MYNYSVDLDNLTTVNGKQCDVYPVFWVNFCNYVQSDENFVCMNGGMFNAVNQCLKSFGILRTTDTYYHIILHFESEADFLIFKLKWS